MRRLGLFAWTSLAAAPLLAQPQVLVETIEVRVANVDVVVRDRAGKTVTGLTKDDFELYDDGIPQKITNFYEVLRSEPREAAQQPAAAEAPLEVRQRRVVVFVDSSSLTPARAQAVLQSVEKFIETRLRPEDRAMLVVWRLGLHVVTPFTNDREALKRGLGAVRHYGPAGESSQGAIALVRRQIDDLYDTADTEQGQRRPMLSWRDAYNQSRSLVERYTQQLIAQQRRLIGAVDQVTMDMAGLDGKKVLVFVGEHFPQHPGSELFRYVNERFSPHLDRNTITDFDTTLGVVGDTTPASIEQLGRSASANGVTIYTIGVATQGNDISAENTVSPQYGYSFTRDANTASGLGTIAQITGGFALTGTTNFDLAFDTIDRDLSSYYSLGYKPSGEGGHLHKIVVNAKNRDYTVRARQSFIVKSTDDQMEDRAIANLYTDPTRNDWPIAVRTGAPKREGRHFLLPVQVLIPPTITLLPQDQNLAGGFVLYFVVGNSNGGTSPVMRRPESLAIPASAEPKVRAKPMTFTTALRIDPGESTLSVAIIDQVSGSMGFARTSVVAR